jgi:hypothetical protein
MRGFSPSFFSVLQVYPETPLMDEMRAELRALKKEAGGNSISKMKKADLERQIEVYRGMVSSDSPAPPRRAEKSPAVSRRESEPAPKKRVAESEGLGGGKPRLISKAPARNRIEYEEEESARPVKSIKAPKVVPKAVAKAASKSPKKMERAVEPEDSGSEFD